MGLSQNERKMLKAQVKLPESEYGLNLDYHFASFMDFLVEVEVDLPIPELKVTTFKLGHISQSLLVVQIECNLVNAQLQYELLPSDEIEAIAAFNNYKLHLKAIVADAIKGRLESKLEVPNAVLELDLANTDSDLEGKLW